MDDRMKIAHGTVEKPLLDTRPQQKSAADIDYDPVQRVIYVPTLTKNSVVAYRLY